MLVGFIVYGGLFWIATLVWKGTKENMPLRIGALCGLFVVAALVQSVTTEMNKKGAQSEVERSFR